MSPLIVGLGLQTSLGASLDLTWSALLQGRHVSDHARVPADDAPGESRITALATAVVRESLSDAGIEIEALRGTDTALIVGTSKGAIEQWLTPDANTPHPSGRGPRSGDRFAGSLAPDERGRPGPFGHPNPAGLADLAGQISGGLGITGPRLTLSAACASGLHALIRGALLIRSGQNRRVIVVAAESSLHALFIGNFQRLGVLPPPGFGCRPFDRGRRGFVMSEAAAAVVLQSPDLEQHTCRRPIALERFGFAGDATHLTGNDPKSRALRNTLAGVIDDRHVDLVHAHGTGTQVNDAAELSALEATLPRGPRQSVLYSHKGALGHSLGASGLVSVVLNCLSHQTGIIPGNIQTREPLESARVQIRRQPTGQDVSRSLAIAAGFGGAIAAVSLCSVPP
jgi:3-oxoacyl-[acyl-carrier-protein] synthase II